KAIPRLESALKANPGDKTSMSELAADYVQINRPDLAIQLTQKLLAGGEKNAQVYFYDGVSQAALGHQKEALSDLENASNLEPTNAAVLGALTNMYLQLKRPQDAERVAKRAVTFNPNDENAQDPHPLVLEAQTYVAQNAIARAEQLYGRATQVDPNSMDALVGKGQLEA